jgi:hypothetical protein
MKSKQKQSNNISHAIKLLLSGTVLFLLITAVQFSLKDVVPSDMNDGVDFAYMILFYGFPLLIPSVLIGIGYGLLIGRPYTKNSSLNTFYVFVTYVFLMFLQICVSFYLWSLS